MWVLVIVFVRYGIIDNSLRVKERVDWMVFHSVYKYLHESTSDKESVILSPVKPVYTLRKNREIKTVSVKIVSVLTKPTCSFDSA